MEIEMTDITEGLDLLGDWLAAKGYTEEAGLCTRAMDEINRLHDELADMRERCKLNYELGVQRGKMDAAADNARLLDCYKGSTYTVDVLIKDNARLREALKPFADVANNHSDKRDDYPLYVRLLVGELRAARAAMGERDE